MTDAERALADDPEGFARLRAVLHGAGPAPGRPLPTLEERFGIAPTSKPAVRRPAGNARNQKATCPSHGTR